MACHVWREWPVAAPREGRTIQRMKKLLAVAVVALIGFFALRSKDEGISKLAFDQFWIDHTPTDPEEQMQTFYISGEHPIGRFATQTGWRGQWEGFHYHMLPRNAGELDLLFGTAPTRERAKLRATACSEAGFDYCLEISGSSRGVKKYFSRKEWRGNDAAEAARKAGFGARE